MKSKQSRLTIIPRAAAVLANQEAATAGVADSVLNMRERERSLQVAGNPASCGSIAAGSKILLIHHTTFGERMLTCAGGQVCCDGSQLVQLGGEPAGACAVGDVAVVACRKSALSRPSRRPLRAPLPHAPSSSLMPVGRRASPLPTPPLCARA